jgi:hypothetical protein
MPILACDNVRQVYDLLAMDDLLRVQLFREISIHSTLQHVNIADFWAAFLVGLVFQSLANVWQG